MAPPSSSRFIIPLETSEAIIDHLCEDRKSLYACSLVCQAWVPKCRSYIFSDICIDYKDKPEKLSTFLSAMRSPKKPGRYVRSLRLWLHHDEIAPGSQRWSNGVPELPILAENLTHVQTLIIKDTTWDEINAAGRMAMLSGFKTVQELSLEDTLFSASTHVTELISSFPSLNSLDCRYLTINFDPDEDLPTPLGPPTPMDLPPPPSLRQLVLDGLTRRIIPWLTAAAECRVSDANLTLIGLEDLKHVVEFFRRLGPSLQLLHLNVYVEEVDFRTITMDLSQNTALSSLRINCGSVQDGEVTDEYLSFISHTLSQIRSSQLHTLDLEMPVEDEHLDYPFWSDLDDILAHPRFSLLENLTLRIDLSPIDEDDIMDHVEHRMPKLVARDIIYFY